MSLGTVSITTTATRAEREAAAISRSESRAALLEATASARKCRFPYGVEIGFFPKNYAEHFLPLVLADVDITAVATEHPAEPEEIIDDWGPEGRCW